MLVGEYVSIYGLGLLEKYPINWRNEPKPITISKFLESHPEYELDELDIEFKIYYNEKHALTQYFKLLQDERAIETFLRELLDYYRANGGDPIFWLHFTFDIISLNPESFAPWQRGIIERLLIQWIDNFKKQPYDLLLNYTRSRDSETASFSKLPSPVISLFCYIVNECKIMEKDEIESIESYCIRVCEKFELIYKDRVRQGYYTSENKSNIDKIKKLILPNIEEDYQKKISTWIDAEKSKINKLNT